MSIQIEHLSHTYMPDTPFASAALRDINLTLEDGELIALLGHTGSGKTTLVQHLNGLLKPTSGRIIVDGLDLTDPATRLMDVRKQVGLVFQYPEYQLFEETVAKDIAFGPKNLGLSNDEINARVEEAMLRVGLNPGEIGERSPFELSGGQMRRVAIAGVLAMKPKTLILDEPAAGLDPAGRNAILEMIRELHSHGDLTVLMVSHSMDDIASLATRLIVMNRGEVILTGTPREVFANGDLLRSAGLDVPAMTELNQALIAEGLDLPKDLYTPDEMFHAILRLAGKEDAAC